MRVYLSGPITGHNDRDIFDWRSHVKSRCPNVQFLDPSQAPVDSVEEFQRRLNDSEQLDLLRFGKNVVTRNKLLIQSADFLFANLQHTGRQASVGSVGEIFWANAYDKPVIILRERAGNVHDHAMLNGIAAKIAYTMDEAITSIEEFSGAFSRSKRA